VRGLRPEQAPYYPTPEELGEQHPTATKVAEPDSDDSPGFSRARRR